MLTHPTHHFYPERHAYGKHRQIPAITIPAGNVYLVLTQTSISCIVYFQRAMVLDYLAHSGYTNTACAFVQDSTIRHLDMDGEEVLQAESGAHQLSDSSLKQAELRNREWPVFSQDLHESTRNRNPP